MTDRGTAALAAWGESLRAARLRRFRLRRRMRFVALGIAVLGLTIAAPPQPRLVWNASASVPIGLYLVTPGTPLIRGDMIVARAPPAARALAAERRYLPHDVPLVKRVAAVPGDTICAIDAGILINGRRVAERRSRDSAGRQMLWWQGCLTLRNGAVLLLTDAPASFDGRYFGPTRPSDIIGKATPLWLR